ncbi:HAAS signaling domain-containing protein [Streptomyces sp. NPDC060198]|uniref:HAAS signaling domain-containing protein n=1 Tax=Streptomyces sp. NPDC060198 TaxID=3347070 RepID=UPI00366690F7
MTIHPTDHLDTDGQEVRRYLDAVEQAVSGLPAHRRKETVGDVAERIAVALAGRPGRITQILAELGAPEQIGAAAVDAYRADVQVPWWSSPRLIVWGLAAGSAVSLLSRLTADDEIPEIFALPVFYLTFCGCVALCLSPWWSRSRRCLALAWLLVPNLFLALAMGATDSLAVQITLSVVSVAVRAGALWWMWSCRTAPEPDRHRFPRWAGVLSWIAVAAVAAGETVLWAVTL